MQHLVGDATALDGQRRRRSVSDGDADGDCEPDRIEDTNGNGSYDDGVDFSDAHNHDTDGDGILDGCEDIGHDGLISPYPPEGSPTKADSDSDGIIDGIEDRNHNGRCDAEETCAQNADTDGDNVPDGAEDRNHNGVWDCPEDANSTPCETKGFNRDTDADGLLDGIELKAALYDDEPRYRYCTESNPPGDHCSGPIDSTCSGGFKGRDGVLGTADDQTCPWQADSDGDGVEDGKEDRNADGRVSSGEPNPRLVDSDDDGLADGVEDANHDGIWDATLESDPARVDTDGDGISDGVEDSGGCLTTPGNPPTCSGEPATGPAHCICGFWRDGIRQSFESDPRLPDTDADGLRDGAEDRNGDGVCQLPAPRDVPRASDESCAYDDDSDGDSLVDGAEDVNGNGLIDAALNETDARRADPDNDCLTDPYELFSNTDPFQPDTDDDGLADGLETDRRLRFDPVLRECVPLNCGALTAYQTSTCPNPTIRDSDGDGRVDGFETINGVATGEDENADGCKALFESNPCGADALQPPVIGDPGSTVCSLIGGCNGGDMRQCVTCAVTNAPNNACGGDDCNEGDRCDDESPCKQARKVSQSLICSEGNIRPVVLVHNEDADYSLALTAKAGSFGVPETLYDFADLRERNVQTGTLFQSKDNLSNSGKEAIRSVFGGVTKLATIRLGSPDQVTDTPTIGVIASTSLTPSDVAATSVDRLRTQIYGSQMIFARTAGGNAAAHDDESTTGKVNAVLSTRATDRYVVRRSDGGNVNASDRA